MSKTRYVLKGYWTGYSSAQARVVHCQVVTDAKLAEWADKAYGIRYTDGTTLLLDVRQAEPRERVVETLRYMKLILDCYRENVTSVDQLTAIENARRVQP